MARWIVQDEPIRVGKRVADLSPPMWVAEAVERVPPSVLVTNYYTRKHNEAHPGEPLPFVPVVTRWHLRLTGGQLSLAHPESERERKV